MPVGLRFHRGICRLPHQGAHGLQRFGLTGEKLLVQTGGVFLHLLQHAHLGAQHLQ